MIIMIFRCFIASSRFEYLSVKSKEGRLKSSTIIEILPDSFWNLDDFSSYILRTYF